MKNKKGFTLVEILAVIVVLVIITVLAINKISDVMKKNNESAVKANALTFIKAVEENASLSRVTGNLTDGIYSTEELNESGIKLSGTHPKGGQVYLLNGKIDSACLVYDKYSATYSNGSITKIEKGTCDSFVIEIAYDFNYTGKEQVFNAQYNGVYKIEAWGAQGGSKDATHKGGYGGYSVGYINLNKGDKLYINVGGKGEDGVSAGLWQGGYNGGGNGKMTPRNDCFNSGGGGATSIATKSGLLAIFTSAADKNKIIIVAGGGGGSGYYNNNDYGNGGSAGGASGEIGGHVSQAGRRGGPGTQLTGYSVGKGEDGSTKGDGGAGGGGGYFGGFASITNGGGGGGSGYIGNSLISNGSMYCYNCEESSEETTKTTSTTCTNGEPTANCAKEGNGYVRISLVV